MTTFPARFLDELRARVPLEAVVGRHVRLSRRGREYVGLSPFQKEKSPSFTVVPDKGFYHDFSSGEHGDVIDFVMKVEGLTFPEAVERLAAEAGLEIPADTPEARERERRARTLGEALEAACAHFRRTLRMPEGRPGLDYLRGRGLTDETIERFRLGFAPEGGGGLKAALARAGVTDELMREAGLIRWPDGGRPDYDYFRGRVMFPIADARGRVIAFGGRALGPGEPKYLNSPESALFEKRTVLYGLDLARRPAGERGTIVAVEGYLDVIALHQADLDFAVAPLGTAITDRHLEALWRIADTPTICLDGDAAGRKAALRAAEQALALLRPGRGLRFATLPEGEDPDSLVGRGGAAAMAAVLDAAVALSEMIWRAETEERAVETPEERAALEARLRHHAARIADPMLRGHFTRAFVERLWRRETAALDPMEPVARGRPC